MVSERIVILQFSARLLYLARTSTMILLSEVWVTPTESRVRFFFSSCRACSRFWYRFSILRAYLTAISPSGVSFRAPSPRMNRLTFRSCSSWRMCWLTAGWVSERSLAALVKFLVSLTFSKVSSLASIIGNPPGIMICY